MSALSRVSKVSAFVVMAGLAVVPSFQSQALARGLESRAASVQPRAQSARSGFATEITKRSLDRYAALLGMDATQKETAAALHQAYAESSKVASEEMQESMKALQEEAEDGERGALFEKMPEIMRKYGEKRSGLQKSFFDDLKSVLTPKQEESWPKVERLRRREGMNSGMPGMVSGSGIDMTDLLPKLKLPEAEHAKLTDAVEQYEQDLDKLLVEREKADMEREGKDGGQVKMDFDMEKIKARMEDARLSSIKVRDLNRQYERKMAALLGDEARSKLGDEFKKRSFRQIFKEPYPTKLLGAAMKLDDLDANQRKALDAEKETYERELTSMNEKWMQALDKAETEGKAGGGMFMMPGMGSESEELVAARKARRELDDKTAERVKTALNEKQREKLPKKKSGNTDVHLAGGGTGVTVTNTIESDDEGDEESGGGRMMFIRAGG